MNFQIRTATALCYFTFFVALSAFAQKAPKPESRFAKLDSYRIHYNNYGSGKETIVFVHGWTCNANVWKANVPAFSGSSHVIALDLLGHGESDKPEITYSMDLFAQTIDAVLKDAKVKQAVLVGHSMGGPVIRQFYRLYPEKTSALVFVDGGLKPMGTKETMAQFLEPYRQPDYKQHAEQIVAYLTRGMKYPAITAEVKTMMLSVPQHTMLSAFEELLNPDIWNKQDKINVPTLALMAASENWDSEYEKFLRQLIPNVDYQAWSDVSHFLMMDEPQKFNDTVIGFLKRNRLIKR